MDNSAEPVTQKRQLLSFVRRNGRTTIAQEKAWDEHSDFYVIDVERDGGETTVAEGQSFDQEEVFGRKAPLIVEIGTGRGDALLHAATEHPELDFLGLEVYRGGLSRTILVAEKAGINNVRLIEANAPEVLKLLLPESIASEIRVFFPDPWHKAKHNKRRLISPNFIELAERVLAPGGIVRMATDWEEYAEQMRTVFDSAEHFTRSFDGDWAERFIGRPITAFEKKGTDKGRNIRDLAYTLTDKVSSD